MIFNEIKENDKIEVGDLVKTDGGYRLVTKFYFCGVFYYGLVDIEYGELTTYSSTLEDLIDELDAKLIAKRDKLELNIVNK